MDEDAHAEREDDDEEDEDDAEGDSSDTVEQEAEETGDDADDFSHLQDLEAVMAATDSDGNGNSTSPSVAYRRLPRRTLFGWGPARRAFPAGTSRVRTVVSTRGIPIAFCALIALYP